MIASLRHYHRIAFAALAITLPAILIAGLGSRRPIVVAQTHPCRFDLLEPGGKRAIVDARMLWGDAVDAPDPLIYWIREQPPAAQLPLDAVLLGSLEAAQRNGIRIPVGAAADGRLGLYSLAWQKLVATAPFPKETP